MLQQLYPYTKRDIHETKVEMFSRKVLEFIITHSCMKTTTSDRVELRYKLLDIKYICVCKCVCIAVYVCVCVSTCQYVFTL